ncbi:MAG TPA: DNA polymerase/3'-5' exonuclease PolX [Usitatibacter sp.]|nr:DNA polymerase/3'-5' exonuclease PolX [Usitatibacter sp.]
MARAAAPVHNADIARAFDEVADLLELQGANAFRVRAYRNAARMTGDTGFDIASRIAKGQEMPKMPGIGPDLAGKMREIALTGTCAALEDLRREFPAGVTELLRVPGLGPRRVAALHARIHVDNLEELARAASEGRLRELPGFGEKTEQRVLQAVGARLSKARRFRLAIALQYAEPFAAYLGATVAGSCRRMKDTVGDLDFLVASTRPLDAIARFAAYPEVREVIGRGSTKASVILASGIQCDLRVVAPESFGAALHYFTGSKAHNIAVRRLGLARGLKINEYGVFRGKRRIAGETEESVYASVGLPYIEPELREDQGELAAAAQGRLPCLVALSELRGDLHSHTSATDGRASLEEMARAAHARGLRYLAITDHSRHLAMTHGLDPAGLARQARAIDTLAARVPGIAVLKGIEVDILGDGTLALPDAALARLDLVVAAVHGQFGLSRERQTARILAAMDNPHVRILAHPTGRLIDAREPYDVDMQAIVRKARERGVALEVDSQPERLDLDDTHCRMARDAGVLIAVSSDAHATADFDDLRYGIGQARRGWLERKDVLNTRSLADLRRWLAR